MILVSPSSLRITAFRTTPLNRWKLIPPYPELLAADMNAHPEHIRPVDSLLVDRIIALVGQVDVDLNTPLLAEDE